MEPAKDVQVRCFGIKRIRDLESECITDTVAVEEPLQIRIRYWFKEAQISEEFAMTMRTPGYDRELVAGLLFSEGIVCSREELTDLRALGTGDSNELLAELAPGVDLEGWRVARSGIMNSSCGICGKRSREALAQQMPPVIKDHFVISRKLIEELPTLLRSRQAGFSQTGGLHAAALIDGHGNVRAAFEDIGRHNALDKLIGFCVLNRQTPLADHIVFMSSRSSFELVQKTAMAGAPVLATVGGPSSLAIETAREHGITLIGFLRQGRFNIYSGEWRINSK
jgi:FdhD protein